MMDFNKLLQNIESMTTTKKSYDDEKVGMWKMTKDKAGNASAVIRFLPNLDQDDIPFVRKYTHSFKDDSTGRWYIENSLSTIGAQDYVGEQNGELWNSGLEENKELARKRKRKLNYISNILVIKDTESPQNEGKVFKFTYGKKIFDKIIAAAKPEEDLGEDPINVFDPLSGADFLLRQTVVAGFPNYDSSKFTSKKPIFTGDKVKIDTVLAQCFNLGEEIAADKFKTYDELKDKFMWVTGQKEAKAAKKQQAEDYDSELDELTKIAASDAPPAKTKKTAKVEKAVESSDDNSDEDFFRSLIED
jgi:hypothetical protein